jgi:Na+-translocating ferredoxin:NAD+ oxidoreductase RnfE subunit
MNSVAAPKATARERITHELREFAVISAYLLVCFTALAYLKSAILQAHGIAFAPFGFAAAKALICAKFILVGRALHFGERFKTLPLIWPTLHKSFVFVLLLIILNVIEEILVGLIHGRPILDSVTGMGGGTIDQMIATTFVVLLILIPFFAFQALGEIVGNRNLARLFFEHHRSVRNA